MPLATTKDMSVVDLFALRQAQNTGNYGSSPQDLVSPPPHTTETELDERLWRALRQKRKKTPRLDDPGRIDAPNGPNSPATISAYLLVQGQERVSARLTEVNVQSANYSHEIPLERVGKIIEYVRQAGRWTLPPILVVEDVGNGPLVLDGHARMAAAEKLNKDLTVDLEDWDGTIPAYEISMEDYESLVDKMGTTSRIADLDDYIILPDGTSYSEAGIRGDREARLVEAISNAERHAHEITKIIMQEVTTNSEPHWLRTFSYDIVPGRKIDVFTFVNRESKYNSVYGRWAPRGGTMTLQFDVTPKTPLSKLYSDIRSTVRHEVEHALQTFEEMDLSYAQSLSDMSKVDAEGLLEYTRSYLLWDKEIEAHVSALYTNAKQEKIPLSKVFDRYFDRARKGLSSKGVPFDHVDALLQEIRSKWEEYARQRFPAAQGLEAPVGVEET